MAIDYDQLETELVLKIEEARINIKKIISNGMLNGINKEIVKAQAKKIAYSLYESILEYGDYYKRMAVETRRSLITNFSYWYREAIKDFRISRIPIITRTIEDFITRPPNEEELKFIEQFERKQFIIGQDTIKIVTDMPTKFKQTGQLFGEDQIQVQNYSKKISNELIERTLTSKRLRRNEPAFNFSRRNHAEMAVRHQEQNEQINELREKGVRLILMSQHINSSERCAPWQNRVYSLDGTRGITDDNNRLEFIPLDEAVNFEGVLNGRVYKAPGGSILGYNCRHRLLEYIPNMRMQETFKYKEEYAKKQRKIDLQMRNYERLIRKEKEKQVLAIDKEERQEARQKSVQLQNSYKQYCRKNNRVYQKWRTSITSTERQFIELERLD